MKIKWLNTPSERFGIKLEVILPFHLNFLFQGRLRIIM